MENVLADLESWLKANYRAAHGSLQPGLTDEAITDLLRGWPYTLSDDVRSLYRWHDGFEDAQVELLPGLSFLPLAEALALGAALWEVSSAQAQQGGVDFFPRAVLPVFSDGQNDVVLLVQGGDPSASTPAQVVALRRGQRLYAFQRLEDLLAASLELLKGGVYRADQERDRVELTGEAAAQAVWRRYPLLYLEGAGAAPLAVPDEDDGGNDEADADLSDEQQAENLMSNLMSMLGLHPDDLDPQTATLEELQDLAEVVPPAEWPEALQQRFQDLSDAPAPDAPEVPAPKDHP